MIAYCAHGAEDCLDICICRVTGARMIRALLSVLGAETVVYAFLWYLHLRGRKKSGAPPVGGEGKTKLAPQLGIGFLANFMDTLGVGSFAITSSLYKLLHLVADDLIP